MRVIVRFISRTPAPALRFPGLPGAKAQLKLVLFATLAFILGFGLSPCMAMEWYVAASVGTSGSGETWQTAFKTIQEGIDAASDGDTILVAQGTYLENIMFNGKNIVLTSTDSLDPSVVAGTIIDGNQAGSVVSFSGGENETCILAGFTIRNGRALHGGGISGTSNPRARATIENNVITANWADAWGGGIYCCDGLIRNNTISGNSADRGGGIARCSGIIEGNVIADNSVIENGGGLGGCSAVIRANIITGNCARQLGGGLAYCSMVENNTIYGNRAERYGGLCGDEGEIRNCIFWGNEGGPQLPLSCTPTYSCIERWRGGGEGNIAYYPHLVGVSAGDFHLASWSPCIDAGDPSSAFSEEPEPNGGRVDMGAYGNTREATTRSPDADRDELPDDWEVKFFGSLGQGPGGDPDGDGRVNVEEYRRGFDPTVLRVMFWYVDGTVSNSGDGTSWATAFKTIQEGLDVAVDGDVVTVAQGTYVENVKFRGMDVVLQSTDAANGGVTEGTVIDGNAMGPVVAFDGAESEACVLAGFTIRNGNSSAGGGTLGAVWDNVTHAWLERTRATIQNNIITGNETANDGGGLYWCDGPIQNNRITDNAARWSGGGLAHCDGRIRNNVIGWNRAEGSGGGLAYCNGTIESNVVAWNTAVPEGGGLYKCDGDIRNNTIADNSAVFGGCEWSRGGGLSQCAGTIRNCIIWANTALYEGQLYLCSAPQYSCILGYEGGTKNTFQNPRFAAGAYQLSGESPCIDAGENDDWMLDAVDLDGNPRIFYGATSKTVDMGAYEYGSWPFKVLEMRGMGGGGALLTWTSRPEDTYTIWSCLELFPAQWTEEITLLSGGETTIWTEPDTSGARKFYKIELR